MKANEPIMELNSFIYVIKKETEFTANIVFNLNT